MSRLKSILIFSAFLIFFSSCEEIFEDDNAEKGTQYLEFKVDGTQFTSEEIPSQCNALQFNYFPEPHLDLPAGYMVMASWNCPDSTSLSLEFQEVSQEYTGTSSLESLNFARSVKPIFRMRNGVIYNRLLDGTITIDQFQGNSKHHSGRLSGTFEMRLIDSDKSDTLNITEGKFNFFIARKLH